MPDRFEKLSQLMQLKSLRTLQKLFALQREKLQLRQHLDRTSEELAACRKLLEQPHPAPSELSAGWLLGQGLNFRRAQANSAERRRSALQSLEESLQRLEQLRQPLQRELARNRARQDTCLRLQKRQEHRAKMLAGAAAAGAKTYGEAQDDGDQDD